MTVVCCIRLVRLILTRVIGARFVLKLPLTEEVLIYREIIQSGLALLDIHKIKYMCT